MNMDPGPMDVDWGAYRIWKEQRAEAKREMRTIREAHIIKLVRHPHIVRFKGLTVSDSSIYISMEYVDGCELYQYILNRGRLSERRAVYFTRQIVSALDYLHRNSIVHRDLKIENIMVERKGRRIKLIDFGLSSLYSPERLMTTFCGSLYFAAPEVLRADAYRGPAVDVWSLGAVIYSMVVGETPFMDVSPYVTQERIKIADVDYPGYLSDNCRDLLRRIFVTDPKRRIILADIIRHPWLTGSRSDGPLRPIKNYVPLRKPLRMCQLKEVVLERMTEGFGLGTVQDVRRRIGIILSSDVYENAAQEVWQMQTSTSSSDTLSELPYDDPQSVPDAYHALVSLYHLIRERMVEDDDDDDDYDDSGPKTSPTPRKLPVLSPKHILGCAMGMEECTKGEGLTAVLAVVRVAGYFNKKVKNII